MNTTERKGHWENVFETNDTSKVSWHQAVPSTSLRLIDQLQLPKTANIIEVGSGDSFMGDYLIEKEFSNLTLLDISEIALETIKKRLDKYAPKIEFVVADVCQFSATNKYDLWHDRAVFHFLTLKEDVEKYVANVSKSLKQGAFFIISTFSNNGPEMCSGLKVQQYSEEQLFGLFKSNFDKIECFTENHTTPSGGTQNFVFCVFQRK